MTFDFVRQIYGSIFNTDKAKMNCSTGLALMKINPSDRPKINVMKTIQTDLMRETDFQSKKKIFTEIFILQMNLAKYEAPAYQTEIKAVIQTIDELMQVMIES